MTIEDMQDVNMPDEIVFPSIMNRVQALFFDFWIVVAGVIGISSLMPENADSAYIGLKILLFFVVLLIYEPFGYMTGGTIGYRTMGMKIRQFERPAKKIRLGQAYFRATIKIFLGWISFLTVSTDPHRRAFHDKISGTIVLLDQVKRS